MKILLILIITLLPALSFGWDKTEFDTVTTYYQDSTIKEQFMRTSYGGNEKGFRKDGQYTSWYTNGRMQVSAEFEYISLPSYSWITWDEYGMRSEDIQYIKGKKHGVNVSWFPNHSERYILFYKDDKLHGLCTWFDKGYREIMEENISRKCFYLNGDILITFLDDHKQIHNTYPYENKELGLWFDFEGRNYIVGKMKNGVRHGKWTTYNERGEMLKQDLYNNDSLITVDE